METPQPQRSRIEADSNPDYITSLPANIKENILMKLPIKEAVRTSILSSKWIDSWVSIPNLVFENQEYSESAFIKMVDMVLRSHQGLIRKFELSSYRACNEGIGRWLLILCRNSVKDLELRFRYSRDNIPFRLVSCIALERLSLLGCNINIPSFFQGFDQLRTLILASCKISGISLEKMVSSCPLLDHLELRLLNLLQDCCCINASNLTCLDIDSPFDDIVLETPKLASACIFLDHVYDQESSVLKDSKESKIIRALGCLSSIQKLQIVGHFLQYLAKGPIPENLPVAFDHLKDLTVRNLYIKPNDISTVLCLLKNAPNLEKLLIQFMSDDQPNVEAAWKVKAIQGHLFKHLKVLKISYKFGSGFSLQVTKYVLEFAKIVLSTAPVLEKLNFIGLGEDGMAIFEMLKWFPKLSKNAEIVFIDEE